MVPNTPTFITREGRSKGGSSNVDLALLKSWMADITTMTEGIYNADHIGIKLTGQRTGTHHKNQREGMKLPDQEPGERRR